MKKCSEWKITKQHLAPTPQVNKKKQKSSAENVNVHYLDCAFLIILTTQNTFTRQVLHSRTLVAATSLQGATWPSGAIWDSVSFSSLTVWYVNCRVWDQTNDLPITGSPLCWLNHINSTCSQGQKHAKWTKHIRLSSDSRTGECHFICRYHQPHCSADIQLEMKSDHLNISTLSTFKLLLLHLYKAIINQHKEITVLPL